MNNLILIGFMGCGKTSVGLQLAKQLNFKFCDTDQIIEEKAKDTINHIFESKGEEYFRQLETETIKELKGRLKATVLSVGGGLPIQTGNEKLIRDLGQVIYLKTSKDTILKRLSGDTTRPLLAGDQEKRIETLLSFRAPIYEAAAHLTVTTDGRMFGDIIDEIIKRTGVQHEIISDQRT
ncbi:shikimate kinase [Anaerocolumna sp. MB42-C2]|uniref:shikimate kinase n=1 Tax=Anaerocolumna sp. MB42-C2 TaxID=3070997 RepID=UPI0027DF99D0|nr:shikimate kinase [Anaerocolumna sp. MB42-C2]WMJ88712.1 shikimate kinase [Anaerocolumna sp. MB42-C2]